MALPRLSPAWRRRIRSMTMHQSLLALVADSRPWPQMTGTAIAASGAVEQRCAALREILRSGILMRENCAAWR
jgi:murein L,D-transpeptidase YcbB/YkuD